MPAAALPSDEASRMAALRAHRVLDTPPEKEFDDFVRQAMEVCGTSVGRISFVDAKREWFKSRVGVEASEAPRDRSFCAHALHTPERPLIVPDATRDARFADNPDVLGGPEYRFYAGFPLRSPEGHALGALCVLDHQPRQLSTAQVDKLRAIAQQVSVKLSLRRYAPAKRSLAWSFGLGLALLLGMTVFFTVQLTRFYSSDQWVTHTYGVIGEIERTLFEVQAAESAQRGYTASGQERYLPPLQAEIARLPGHLRALRQAAADNPLQLRNIAQLQTAIEAKVALMGQRVEERRTLGLGALDALHLNGRGQSSMEGIIGTTRRMIGLENILLNQRRIERASRLHTAAGMLLGTSLLGAGLLAAGFLFTWRELRRSQDLGGALAQANLGLEAEVAERRRAQQQLSAEHDVARIAAEHVSLPAAAPGLLQSICEHLDWEVGELWSVQAATGVLQMAEHWHSQAGHPAQAASNAGFVEASRAWRFARGEGLPGEVWSGGEALWEHDLRISTRFLRTAPAQTAGLRRAFAFPLHAGQDEQVTSVMVFFSKEEGAPDATLVATMETVAGQVAQFTNRCRAEVGLRASQARFSAFIENAPALAYIKDAEGRMLYGNETLLRTFHLRADQWLGKTDADFWPEAAPELRENDAKVLAGSGAIELYESVPLPGGRTSRWLSYKFPLHDEATGRKLLAGISVDITAREEAAEFRRAKEEAERASRAKSEFLSRVSHELRTPLNAILGFGQLLQTTPRDAQDAEALEYILKAGRHLLGLVNEVLDLTRAESGDLQLAPSDVSLGEMVKDCMSLTARLASERGIQCERPVGEEGVSLWCDEKRLRQILLNLLSNAIKYNRPGGKVAVRYERTAADQVRLLVSDTGHGIAPESIHRLFMPFERLEQGAGKVEGIGLGLVVSRQMAEAMGGRMGVESRKGQGSTFWLELPVGSERVVPAVEVEPVLDAELLSVLGL